MSSSHDVTRLLGEWAKGDQQTFEQLIPLVNGELRQIAASYLRKERQGHMLQPTAVVHEAYIRLVHQMPDPSDSAKDGSSRADRDTKQPTHTIADGIEVRVPVQSAVEKMKNLVDDIVLVDDDALIEAMRLCVSALGLVLEPSGAAGLAAILSVTWAAS